MTIKIDNSRTVMIQAEMGYVQCVTESGHGYTKPHILSNIIVNPMGFIIKLNCERTSMLQPFSIEEPRDTAFGAYLEKYRESFIVWCRIPAPFVLRRLSLSTKRQKIGAELEKARAKRDEWERRVKALEVSYEEAKKTEINDIVEAANITPEELAALIRKMKTEMPGSVTDDTEAEEENT